jgi:hypothetical protein
MQLSLLGGWRGAAAAASLEARLGLRRRRVPQARADSQTLSQIPVRLLHGHSTTKESVRGESSPGPRGYPRQVSARGFPGQDLTGPPRAKI